ncbi:ABC transporter substrate-binding protein [Chitinimonas lacunae]|uniref:ABC transporter substrate-binding protein n=1 Tax=Chitinimonas lacunae TaxID=1963018 RepID=A0ABV8MMX2_9NEIS
MRSLLSVLRGSALALSALLCLPSWAADRSVVDASGATVTVPDKPQRPLALSELDLDALLALKLTPVGTVKGRGQDTAPRYLGPAAARVPLVGGFGAPVLDRVIALQPDLILAGGIPDPELLAQLKRIAPTVITYRLGEDWKAAFERIGRLVNRAPQHREFMTGYQKRVEEVRTRLGKQASATVSVVRWNPQGPAYMLKDSFASLVLADLQLKRPASQLQPGVAHSQPLSLEALDRIDGDWLFIGTLSPTGQATEALNTARQSPAFRQLRAVQQQRMVGVDGSLWTSLGGPLAALTLLGDVDRAMAGR